MPDINMPSIKFKGKGKGDIDGDVNVEAPDVDAEVDVSGDVDLKLKAVEVAVVTPSADIEGDADLDVSIEGEKKKRGFHINLPEIHMPSIKFKGKGGIDGDVGGQVKVDADVPDPSLKATEIAVVAPDVDIDAE